MYLSEFSAFSWLHFQAGFGLGGASDNEKWFLHLREKKTFELHFRLQQTYFFSNVRRNKKDFWLKLKKDNIRRICFIFCLFWLFVGGHRYDTGWREMMGWSPWEMFRSHLGLSWKLFYLKFATFPFLRHQEHSFHFGIPLLWRKVVWEVVFWCLVFWGVACAGSPRHTTQCRSGNPHWLQVSQGTWLGVANPFFSGHFCRISLSLTISSWRDFLVHHHHLVLGSLSLILSQTTDP